MSTDKPVVNVNVCECRAPAVCKTSKVQIKPLRAFYWTTASLFISTASTAKAFQPCRKSLAMYTIWLACY